MTAKLLRYTVVMSQGGRSNRDIHNITFLARSPLLYVASDARQACNDLAAALAGVMFSQTFFLRCAVAEIDNIGKVIPGIGFSETLTLRGDVTMTTGHVYASEKVCLRIGKNASVGKAGSGQLRHVIDAPEWAAWLTAGTVPTRFGDSAHTGFGSGEALGDNLALAFSSNNLTPELPPQKAGPLYTARPILTFTAQEFDEISATKRRKTAKRSAVDALQRKLNGWAHEILDLLNPFAGLTTPTTVVTAVNALVTVALAAYNAATIEERVLLRLPAAIAML